MYERIKPYLEPLMQMGEWVGGKLGIVTTGGGSGSGSSPLVNYNGAAMGPSPLVSSGGQSPGQSLLMQAQAQSRTQLEGGLVVRFENAPAGMRADPGTSNQPGLSVTPRVGYRSLGGTSQ